MGISVRDWLIGKLGLSAVKTSGKTDITCMELWEATQEYRLRELAFHTCVNMIANAVGKCEFKNYQNGKPLQGREYYLWNFEPNINQNSTEFIHKLIYKLCSNNEALVIPINNRNGQEMLVVADSFEQSKADPSKTNEYQNVVVNDTAYAKTFRENEVLHFKLNHMNVKPVLEAMTNSFNKMMAAATKNYSWGKGNHWKVHITQTEQNSPEFKEQFNQMLNEQIKPFYDSDSALLPEFDGYDYSEIGNQNNATKDTRDIRSLADDIFDFTARGLSMPPVLLFGDVAGTGDAMTRWLTTGIDPLCDQLQEEIVRKRYGFEEWQNGNYLKIDTSTIIHFDMFANASNIEKLIGSGAFCINDVLAAAGQSQIDEPWAWAHWLTLNISTIEKAAQPVDNGKEGGNQNGTQTNVGN